MDFVNITAENIDSEHLCCIIRSKKTHPGIEAKRAWLRERLNEGHVFRKLSVSGVCSLSMLRLKRHGRQSSEKIITTFTAFGCRAHRAVTVTQRSL